MGVGFQGRKGELGLPGPQGPPGPPGKGAYQIGKGVVSIGPRGNQGERGEKVGVDHDDDFSITSNYSTLFFSRNLPHVALKSR